MENNIRELRDKLGMSLSQLSKASGVSKAHLSRVERNEMEPSLRAAYSISKAFKQDVYRVFPEKT